MFTPDGTYSAFGETYQLADFPTLVAAAPKGLFMVGPPAIELDGDTGTGEQPLCFVDQTNHAMRIGWYTDTYRRTEAGWRLATRKMTFLRKSGARDSGKPHDPTRPAPTGGETSSSVVVATGSSPRCGAAVLRCSCGAAGRTAVGRRGRDPRGPGPVDVTSRQPSWLTASRNFCQDASGVSVLSTSTRVSALPNWSLMSK